MTQHPTTTTRRHRRIALAAVCAGAAVVGTASALPSAADVAPQDLVTSCTGTAGAVTVPGDLFVPAGRACVLEGTTVQGNVDVRAGADLVADGGATIEGDVLVRADAYLELVDATLLGQTDLRGAYGGYAESSSLGDVDARNSGFYYTHGAEQGDLAGVNTQTVLESGWVAGDVTSRGGLTVDVTDTVITGGLDVRNAELGSIVCSSEVDGAVDVRGSVGGVVQLGGGPYAECGANVFAGDLALRNNQTAEGSHVVDNIVRGDLVCTGNDPAPVGEGNRVRGAATGQCASLEAAGGASIDPRGDADLPSRTAELERLIEQRSDRARASADVHGTADLG